MRRELKESAEKSLNCQKINLLCGLFHEDRVILILVRYHSADVARNVFLF